MKIFVTFFLRNVRPRRLKLGTHVDSGQMYRVYRNQAAAAYSPLYFFIFLSNFQTLKFFVTLFSGTVRPRRLKLGTQWADVSCIQESGCCCLFVPSFFFLSNLQTLKFFVTLFSGTVRPRRLKHSTHVDSGQMYRVYWNQATSAYLSLYFSLLFLSNFQTLKFFVTFIGTVRPRRLKLLTHVDNGWMYRVYRNHATALICPFIFHFSFSQIFMH